MGQDSRIEWCDHTFNPWWGCTEISPGCDHCYAHAFARRTGHDVWGAGAARRVMSDKHWEQPLRWARTQHPDGRPWRVFCGSMCDWADKDAPAGQLERLWETVRATPTLQWLMLTKRIGRVHQALPPDWGRGYPNVWLMITVVNQEEADRDVPKLLATPAAIRGVSYEPALEAVEFWPWLHPLGLPGQCVNIDGEWWHPPGDCRSCQPALNWIILGGESGPRRRLLEIDWIQKVADEARGTAAALFVKQDSAQHPGQQGRIPDHLWALKEFPA